MDIIERLRKEKKKRSVFDIILKGKETKAEEPGKSPDIEVRELEPTAPAAAPQPEQAGVEPGEEEQKPIREFRTEGMHEFDIDSLGISGQGALKAEYKARLVHLIDKGTIDEAIDLLKELRVKLLEGPKVDGGPSPPGGPGAEI
ncbi:MAG: hypothetical protein JSW49_01765 [candidate division WOR-3 bacterium]|nr:MAG: hypothetical protein JSW49_01765 [candidate division WOR-3 bacterium]